MKRLYFIIFVCLVCLTSVLHAQYSVSGEVKNEKNEPLANVTVVFLSHDTLVGGVITNDKGKYELRGLNNQSYKASFSLMGYKGKEINVQLTGNRKLNVQLEEDPIALKEVAVNANRNEIVEMNAGSSTFYLSEANKKKSLTVFQALKEVPALTINETTQEIRLVDGSVPVIMINGVKRNDAYRVLDPKNIEAVEIIDNPSSRYRGETGDIKILNLRVKRNIDLTHTVNLFGKEQVNLKFGYYSFDYAMENSKFSLDLSANTWNIPNEKTTDKYYVESSTMTRNYSGKNIKTSNSPYINLNGDWVISDNDYLSYGIVYNFNPGKFRADYSGSALANDGNNYDLRVANKTKDSYNTGSYNLFYRHTFDKYHHFEGTAVFGHHKSGSEGWRNESAYPLYAYYNAIDMDSYKKYFNAELNYDFTIPKKFAFNVGSNTYYQNISLEELTMPEFPYKETREYIYADVKNINKSKFSYMFSLGLDMVFRDADGSNKNYITVLPSLSLAYKFNNNNSLRLNFNRTRVSPGISQLNPRITTTDSLDITVGNPYLKPVINNRVRLSYTLNAKKLYFQPYVQYTYKQDAIVAVSELLGDVYKTTYANDDHSHRFVAAFTATLRPGNFGMISITPTVSKNKIDGMSYSGNSWGINGWMNLYYKNVSFNANFWYERYDYTRYGRTSNSPMIEMTLGWSLPKGWGANIGIRENMSRSKTWTKSGSYYSYYQYSSYQRRWMPMVGFSYTFRSKNKSRNKQYQRSSDIEDFEIKVK